MMGRKPSRWENLPARMRARVRKYGTYYFYDKGGKPRVEIPLGSDFVEAVKKWAELEKDATPTASKPNFLYAAERYTREIIPTKQPRTQEDNIKELRFLIEFFGNPPAPLDEIKPVHIHQYMDWRIKKAKELAQQKNAERISRGLAPLAIAETTGKVRANREKALFSHIFNKARQWGLTAAPNPCLGVDSFREDGRGDVYVEDVAYKAVYAAADEPTKEAMDLAYLTGQRPADVLAYTEADIKDGLIAVQQGKTKKKLRIEIVGELAALINRIQSRKRSLDGKVVSLQLIVNEQGRALTLHALQQRFDRARDLAKVDKTIFQFRDLRAKAATDTAEMTDTRTAQKQLGHASAAMTEHYIRNRLGDKVKPTK
jgi:integrase